MGFSAANENRVLPSSSEASKIVQYWTALNSALQLFGGTSLSSESNYWTSSQLRQYYYYFNSSGVTTTTNGDSSYSVRTIVRH